MRTIRITVGGAGDPGGPGRRRIGLWLLTAVALPILITAGVGYGEYHAFFRVLELRALLFEGGHVARDGVVPRAAGAVVLSQDNAQPVAEVFRTGARQADAARVFDRGSMLWDKPLAGAAGRALPRWPARAAPASVALPVALDRPNRLAYETPDLRTGRSLASVTTEVEAASWEGTVWTDEAAWLTIASPYRVAFGAGTVTRVWPWQSLSNCQNIGGKIVCTR
jgi:hypothetical protein